MYLHVCKVLLFWTLLELIGAKDFYCARNSQVTEISGENEGRIITTFEGKSSYEDNQYCKWHINAGPNKRLRLTVELSDLQYAQRDSICDTYDHVKISEADALLVAWCGSYYPKAISTRGQDATVVFSSDGNTPFTYTYKGARIKLETFDANACPPNWTEAGEACFIYRQDKENWYDAQLACNYEQGNLASIATKEEYETVDSQIQMRGKTWIGLNDIASRGSFQWIDQASTSAFFSELKAPSSKEFEHCVVMDTEKGMLTVEECDQSSFGFLCKTDKDHPSDIYPVPQEETDKGDGNEGRVLLLGLLIPAISLLVIIIVGICIYRKCYHKKSSSSKRYESTPATTATARSPVEPSTPNNIEMTSAAARMPPPAYESLSNQQVAPQGYVKRTGISYNMSLAVETRFEPK